MLKIVGIVGVVLMLVTASKPLLPGVEVTYRVPKNYSGLLLLAFNMPGGLSPQVEHDIPNNKVNLPTSIVIDFDDHGVARYGNESLPNSIELERVLERETGERIPIVFNLRQLSNTRPSRAIMRDGGRTIVRKGRKELTVETFLVGDPAKFPDTLIGYQSEEIDRLLLKHFGLPLPEKGKDDRK